MSKIYLLSILNNIDKAFPNIAMAYGLDESGICYVFVLLDDENMYFAQQIADSDELVIKRIEMDRIQKISFLGHTLTIQVKDKLFDLFIKTNEAALRALCKEFKAIKSKEAKVHGGRIMDQSFEECPIIEASVRNSKSFETADKTEAENPIIETEVSPIELMLESLMSPTERTARIFEKFASGIPACDESDFLPISEFESKTEPDTKGLFTEELVEQESETIESLPAESESKELASSKELPSSMSPIKEAIPVISPTLNVIKDEQVLTKKELKRLKKEEFELYGDDSSLFKNIAIVLALLGLIYLGAGQILSQLNIIHLPLSEIPGQIINLVQGITEQNH